MGLSSMADANPPNPVDALVGSRLRERRLQCGVALQGLSAQTGVSTARLLRFEKGLERIPAATMVRFCGALDIHVAYFFGRAADEAKSAPGEAEGFVAPQPSLSANRERRG